MSFPKTPAATVSPFAVAPAAPGLSVAPRSPGASIDFDVLLASRRRDAGLPPFRLAPGEREPDEITQDVWDWLADPVQDPEDPAEWTSDLVAGEEVLEGEDTGAHWDHVEPEEDE